MVVGGRDMKSSEIFDAKSNLWRNGPELPKNIGYSQFVMAAPSSEYRAVLIGGASDGVEILSDIYGLTKDYKKFVKIGNLKDGRFSHIAMVLPEEFIETCNN